MEMEQVLSTMALADERLELAKKYAKARHEAGVAKMKLDLILASKYLKKFRDEKKNLGYEMALLMLIEQDNSGTKEVEGYYATFIGQTANYKAIEKMLEAMDSKITLQQSILRWEREGEK